ncbi:uncharacterized protein BDV14DRAFT_209580 [Aspergillus stella-maris]|uniref:uncharacterized protein n=1 Tax=Aspergillus stella-maris TaxID=1810926 RepID=UPI003CCDED7B
MQASRPEQQHPRRSTACDACFRRKIKCDRARPRCNWCSHRQADCTYSPRPGATVRKKRHEDIVNSTTQKRNLIDRIRHIDQFRAESGLREDPAILVDRKLSPCQNDDLLSSAGLIPLPPSPWIIHFAGWKIGNPSPEHAATPSILPEGLQWIKSKTGATVPFPKFHKAPWEKSRLTSTSLRGVPQPSTASLELPPRGVLDRYLDAYWSSAVHANFPVINADLFTRTINAAYSHSEAGPCQSSRACIFAVLALISGVDYPRAHCSVPVPPNMPRDDFILEAQRLLSLMICEESNLDTLQANVIMGYVRLMTGDVQALTQFISIASRSIIAAGIHTMTDPEQMPQNADADTNDMRVKKHLRNLFWLCYLLDKDLALRTGQSHCLKDEDCNLQLPRDYVANLCSRVTYPAPISSGYSPLFPVELRLSLIKSRIFTALYSYQSLQKSDAEIIKLIRVLDDDLEHWRLSLPSDLRPTLTYGTTFNKSPNTMTMVLIIMHLNYYFCVNIVHLAGSWCESWRSTCSLSDMMDGLRSSLTMSVAVSRSLLLFLQDAESLISTGSFWSLLFYTMSAILTLFCNLLESPMAMTTAEDIRLLARAEHTIERIFSRQILEIDQASHIQAISAFVSRLRQLAQQGVKTWT